MTSAIVTPPETGIFQLCGNVTLIIYRRVVTRQTSCDREVIRDRKKDFAKKEKFTVAQSHDKPCAVVKSFKTSKKFLQKIKRQTDRKSGCPATVPGPPLGTLRPQAE
jgi:hypothetical protein